jgi:outer membrane protein
MKKLLFVPLLIASLLAAIPAFASEGIAVIDMRNAVLATQVAQDAFKALEEETEYAANIERATLLQSERQAIAEKLQKDAETLSQEEIADMQRDVKLLLGRENVLFADTALDLTDDVTSMLDVAAANGEDSN